MSSEVTSVLPGADIYLDLTFSVFLDKEQNQFPEPNISIEMRCLLQLLL